MANSIYLKQLIDKNVGPLTDVRIDFPFHENGDPKPVILVGENGTGKSTVLSNIVDAFFEMAGKAFVNVQQNELQRFQYFKTISPIEVHAGAWYLYSFISFAAEKPIDYIFKSGILSMNDFITQIGKKISFTSWIEDDSIKDIHTDKKPITDIWKNNVICYFGPDRYEKPVWMGNKYYQTEEALHPSIRNKRYDFLQNPIIVRDVTSSNLQWLLDVIVDSRCDISGKYDAKIICTPSPEPNIYEIRKARQNLEIILSKILGEEIYFQLNYRNIGNSRFRIVRKYDNVAICPTLDSLSTGQIVLFNLFATIIRYADNNNINHSIHLDGITGIVVIDEIELHLHSKLQKEVLPHLIKLFPKIQFVITSHSPLFLLGMKEVFGEDGFDIYEMPNAEKISAERFAEFQRAYDYLKHTETYQREIQIIQLYSSTSKTIIVTEGSTDWKHLKAAFENLKSSGKHQNVFDGLDFEFFEYESENNREHAVHKIEMGNTKLCNICEIMSKLPPQSIRYIFIADNDDNATTKKLSADGKRFKSWGNNVYSFVLPVPDHRKETPAISIEHYYTDEEIKTELYDPEAKISRRLYMGNEFDKRGASKKLGMLCEGKKKCGSSSIAIIDGSSGEKVTSFGEDNGTNYALPKSQFARMILEKQPPFDNFNFDCFLAVFEIIKSIINDNQENDND